MTSAPLPANEVERLAAVHRYQILDTEPEPDFDEITSLASYICDAPISVISLIDSTRQWFKSSVGLDVRETPRDRAFCAHTILQNDVMVVKDALKDKRFFDNPLVTASPNIRFYAGAPLVTPDGFALGSLCAMDTAPHELKPQQLAALKTLADQVVKTMELRAAYARMRDLAEQLRILNMGKDRLFKLVSHDLRSPFCGVLVLLELMAEGSDAMSRDEIKSHLKMLSMSATETYNLLDGLLQWATFEAGTLPYRPKKVRVDEVANGVLAVLQGIAQAKSITLKVVPNTRTKVNADRAMLHSILQNLIANALKFTQKGGSVTISSRELGDWVEISVTDTGVGITSERLNKLMGYESGESTTGTSGEVGTGLGLNFCRSFIERHGGTLSGESDVATGTTLRFTMPCA
jgi:signal transduction histidine kinase